MLMLSCLFVLTYETCELKTNNKRSCSQIKSNLVIIQCLPPGLGFDELLLLEDCVRVCVAPPVDFLIT